MTKLYELCFGWPFWGRGFRPFFFMGTLYSVIVIALWGAFYAGHFVPPSFLNAVFWHAHEMVYGFSMAIVAGFLLTAVANWTNTPPVRHMHLALLCFLWFLGRLVMNFDFGLAVWQVIAVESLFIPALFFSLAVPLFKSRNARNFIFLFLLTVLFISDILFLVFGDLLALYPAIMMFVIMISLIGGRIIPAFTVAALRRKGIEVQQTDQTKMDLAALLSLMLVALCLIFFRESPVLNAVAVIACLIHILRMRHYHTFKTFGEPLLWVLHAGYAWLIMGLGLLAFTGSGLFTFSAVLHVLTAGCMGTMILGMICRVTLGHTGRELKVGFLTTVAFLVIQTAALIRIFGPVVLPEHTVGFVVISALLWSLCYLVYLGVYGKMLFTPRPDLKEA